MTNVQKEPISAPKRRLSVVTRFAAYVGGGSEPQRCKNKCAKEPAHVLNCKCRAHEMQ